MEKGINKFWKIMPLFYIIHNDDVFDDEYWVKGFNFLFSIVILPITFLFWAVGYMFRTR